MVQGLTGWNDAFAQGIIKQSEDAKGAKSLASEQSIMTAEQAKKTIAEQSSLTGWDKEFTDLLIQKSMTAPKDGPKVGDKKHPGTAEHKVKQHTTFVYDTTIDPEDFQAKKDNFGYMPNAQTKPATQGSKKSRPCSDNGCEVKGIHSHPNLTQPWPPAAPDGTSKAHGKDASAAVPAKSGQNIQAPMYSEIAVPKNTSLWAIAKEQLGEGASDKDIANYVKDIAKANNLKNPNIIRFGQKLKIPFTDIKRAEVYQTQVENPRLTALEAREKADAARRKAEKEALETRVGKYQNEVEEPRLLRTQRQAEAYKKALEIKGKITDGIKAAGQNICDSEAALFLRPFIPICEK